MMTGTLANSKALPAPDTELKLLSDRVGNGTATPDEKQRLIELLSAG